MLPPKPIRRISIALAVIAIALSPLWAMAGAGPSQCDDLSAFEPTPRVDFEASIQPILSSCTGCHGSGGAAGLDLRAGRAYANLVGVTATTNPQWLRVAPGAPDRSLMLAAINCEVTGGPGFQMPGTEPAQRALIRDWIAQGALRRPAAMPVPTLSGPGLLLAMILALFAGLLALLRRAD
ncbi:MAG: hypothetical protein ACNS61_01920 [Candidatus Wenzhouxiangella sp. M2_3B_020]